MTASIRRDLVAPEVIRSALATAARRANQTGRQVLASQTVKLPSNADPLDFFAASQSRFAFRSYWERPADQFAIAGVGSSTMIRTDCSNRFGQAAAEIDRLLNNAVIDGDSDSEPFGPVFLGGFRFDPEMPRRLSWPSEFSAGSLVLPRFMLVNWDGHTAFTVNCIVEPDSDPSVEARQLHRDLSSVPTNVDLPFRSVTSTSILEAREFPAPDAWKSIVAAAAADIRAGIFDKIVLARQLQLFADRTINPMRVLSRLRDANPTAFVFAFATPGGCFVGATPELLARRHNGAVDVSCIAGSMPRGETREEDERLGAELLNSSKNRHEHNVVALLIQNVLEDVCDDVWHGETHLMKLPTVQHLYTSFEGHLSSGNSLLDVVGRLHPTPGVGAYPQLGAIEEIRIREGVDRGWYAGPVGWIDAAGRGEFAVALRSGLIRENEALLYAGCGIVGDSHPDAEYDEAGLKFRPMLAALGID